MIFARLVPLILASGTMVVAAKEGPATVKKVSDAVSSMLQRAEIQSFTRMMEADAVLEQAIPQPGDGYGLAKWLRNSTTASGGRDPGEDRWGNGYVLEKTDEPNRLRLLSKGGNGARDACGQGVSLDDENDDICEEFDVPRTALRRRSY